MNIEQVNRRFNELEENYTMNHITKLPETYEEYGRINGFGEKEMNDEFAPIARKYYEASARLLNQFPPFTREEVQELRDNGYDTIFEFVDALFEYGHINKQIYEESIDLLEEMGACPEEQWLLLGFVYDLFTEWWMDAVSNKQDVEEICEDKD